MRALYTILFLWGLVSLFGVPMAVSKIRDLEQQLQIAKQKLRDLEVNDDK